jgi:hypothetical protein
MPTLRAAFNGLPRLRTVCLTKLGVGGIQCSVEEVSATRRRSQQVTWSGNGITEPPLLVCLDCELSASRKLGAWSVERGSARHGRTPKEPLLKVCRIADCLPRSNTGVSV